MLIDLQGNIHRLEDAGLYFIGNQEQWMWEGSVQNLLAIFELPEIVRGVMKDVGVRMDVVLGGALDQHPLYVGKLEWRPFAGVARLFDAQVIVAEEKCYGQTDLVLLHELMHIFDYNIDNRGCLSDAEEWVELFDTFRWAEEYFDSCHWEAFAETMAQFCLGGPYRESLHPRLREYCSKKLSLPRRSSLFVAKPRTLKNGECTEWNPTII